MDEPRTLPRDQLIPWPGLNPRRMFEVPDLQELRESLEADGMLQPVGVTLQEEPPHFIYAGERRWRAAEGILEELPVIIRDIDEPTARRLALTENIQRSALTPVEEAEGIEKYLEASGSTQGELAEELGKSQSWISNRLRLLRLPDSIRELIQNDQLTASQARDLILPFSKIPQWERLAAAVATRLDARAEDGLHDELVRSVVAAVAIGMSGWLDARVFGHDEAIEGISNYLTLAPKHWKTAPKGSLVQYEYSHRGHHSTRCFDAEWWLHAMRKEQRREDRRQKKRETELEARHEDGGENLDWSPDRGPIPADHYISHFQHHLVYRVCDPSKTRWGDPLLPIGRFRGESSPELYDESWSIFVDPEALEERHLVLREGDAHRDPEILCTDAELYRKAENALTIRRERLYEERIRRQAEIDLERAPAFSASRHLEAIVALGIMSNRARSWLEDLADELGLELPDRAEEPKERWRQSWEERLVQDTWAEYEWLLSIDPPHFQELVSLGVERLLDEKAPHPPRDGYGLLAAEQIRRSVNFELRCEYRRQLERKASFPLPTFNQETEDDEE